MNINLTLIAQFLWFFAFVWFTARFVWPPLMRAVDDRQKKIADGLAAAEKGQQELVNAGVDGFGEPARAGDDGGPYLPARDRRAGADPGPLRRGFAPLDRADAGWHPGCYRVDQRSEKCWHTRRKNTWRV